MPNIISTGVTLGAGTTKPPAGATGGTAVGTPVVSAGTGNPVWLTTPAGKKPVVGIGMTTMLSYAQYRSYIEAVRAIAGAIPEADWQVSFLPGTATDLRIKDALQTPPWPNGAIGPLRPDEPPYMSPFVYVRTLAQFGTAPPSGLITGAQVQLSGLTLVKVGRYTGDYATDVTYWARA